MVGDIGGAEGGAAELVLVVVYGCLRAADDAAGEFGVAIDVNIEAAVASLDAALFDDGCVGAVDVGAADVGVKSSCGSMPCM